MKKNVVVKTLMVLPAAALSLLVGYVLGALILVFIGYVAWRYYD